MCGIVGYTAKTSDSVADFNIEAAIGSLAHRGPDNQGIFQYGNTALSHRRLSIIDVSESANQPMTDLEGRYTLVFNGEIYNFKSIRDDLLQKGYSFNTTSDTEVLLYAWNEWQEKVLARLNGFFAFAIYDSKEDILCIARDRFGIKPLYLYESEGVIAFASELRALIELGIPLELDHTSLHSYLQFNYLPADRSILKSVRKLQPGCMLKLDSGNSYEEQYFKIPWSPGHTSYEGSYEQAKLQLTDILDQSVQRRMVSDVPLGAFLSGGIDSSVITALASRHTNQLNTFSIGYKDEPFFDETSYANLVAKKYRTNHTVFSLTNDDLYSHLDHILDSFDEPFADSSAIAVYILSQHTRKSVKVALSGDGADELFAGYNKHMAEYRVLRGGFVSTLVKGLQPVYGLLPKSRNSSLANKFRQLDRYANGAKLNPAERYWQWASISSPNQVTDLLCLASRDNISTNELLKLKSHLLRHLQNGANMNAVLRTDVEMVLPGDMLTKVDRMSMANSLEVRVPFLDHKVVEFAFSLPEQFKIGRSMKKRILQDAFRDLLPAELYNRPKHGFEVPLLKWLRSDLKSISKEYLLSADFVESQGIFSPHAIDKLIRQLHSSTPGDSTAKIWAVIVFQRWWDRYLS